MLDILKTFILALFALLVIGFIYNMFLMSPSIIDDTLHFLANRSPIALILAGLHATIKIAGR